MCISIYIYIYNICRRRVLFTALTPKFVIKFYHRSSFGNYENCYASFSLHIWVVTCGEAKTTITITFTQNNKIANLISTSHSCTKFHYALTHTHCICMYASFLMNCRTLEGRFRYFRNLFGEYALQKLRVFDRYVQITTLCH